MVKKKLLIGIIPLMIVFVAIAVLNINKDEQENDLKKLNKEATVEKNNIVQKENEAKNEREKESEDVKEEEPISNEPEQKVEDKKDGKVAEEVKETVKEKEDDSKVTVNPSSSNTPSQPVKVEKKPENKTETNKESSKPSPNTSTSNKSSDNNTTAKTKEESKPKDTITTKTTTATESIAFNTVKENDNSLDKGKEIVAQEGLNGTRTITYKETYKNGKLVSKEQVSSEITKDPVNKIIKVGTKEAPKAPKYLSADQAHSILSGSGMSKGANSYTLSLGHGTDVYVTISSSHVTGITFKPENYIPWKIVTEDELIAIFGLERGKEEYKFARNQAAKIEKAVRAAANAVYGSGTSQANSLYNQIINSEVNFNKTF